MAEELRGIEYLRRKLNEKRTRVLLRYEYYDMKKLVPDFGISTPPMLRRWVSTLGWCGKAVDSLADRLLFLGFRDDNFGLGEIYNLNNPDILASSTILSALIGSCSFIYIYPADDGAPRMECIDGANATGELDPVTGLLKEGYAVLKRDDGDRAITEAYYVPGKIYYFDGGILTRTLDTYIDIPLLVPVIYKGDAKRPFGHSRISRACMSILGSAIRTVKRSEISAEFYSFPQKYVVGLSEDAEKFDKWQATISSLLRFDRDENGNTPELGQFQQQSMGPHLEQLRMFASLFAGETGLTLDDLGFPSDNPSSADAIRSQHENLRLAARRAQRNFGTGLLNAGYVARCMRDEYTYKRDNVYLTTPIWAPIFEPDASQLSGIGDAVNKIQQSFPDYFTADKLQELVGI